MVYVRIQELIHLITESLYSLTNISLFPPPFGPWKPLFKCKFYEFDFQILHMSESYNNCLTVSGLQYFTYTGVLQAHTCCCKWQDFFLFYDLMMPVNAGDTREGGSIPRSGRSSGGRNGNPLQYSCLENSMDKGAWLATVHRITKSWTWLSGMHLACTQMIVYYVCTYIFVNVYMYKHIHDTLYIIHSSLKYWFHFLWIYIKK